MKKLITIIMMLCLPVMALAQTERFCIAQNGIATPITVDEKDWKGVLKAADDLSDDVRKVTGVTAKVATQTQSGRSIMVGTIGKSRIVDELIRKKKIDVRKVKGQWESYLIDVVDGNLVIAGSDKRGTIYSIYEISKRIGISPWYWMADAPVKHQDEVWYDDIS